METGYSSARTCDLSLLVAEYAAACADAQGDDQSDRGFARAADALVRECDWTPPAAAALITLVRDYGSFALRNAAALAIALHIEDGQLGY